MDMVKITSTETGRTIGAEVIQRTDKKLIIIVEGTTVRLTMLRENSKKPYVGRMGNMEFISNG